MTGERYLTRLELAERMGVSPRTIDRLVREGMPSETWGRRTRRFLPSEAIPWASSRNSHDPSTTTILSEHEGGRDARTSGPHDRNP